jgi:hypothetical protein
MKWDTRVLMMIIVSDESGSSDLSDRAVPLAGMLARLGSS